ncbi:hypothetical protein EDD86DRAFT_247710 [Gorgonomyces haynaldii]|nr:hypothetical protein EDD86DRAFT_247710 [Gorgonomyces haynaldii]
MTRQTSRQDYNRAYPQEYYRSYSDYYYSQSQYPRQYQARQTSRYQPYQPRQERSQQWQNDSYYRYHEYPRQYAPVSYYPQQTHDALKSPNESDASLNVTRQEQSPKSMVMARSPMSDLSKLDESQQTIVEEQYQCDWPSCNSQLSYSTLKGHLLTHVQKPHSCDICGLVFALEYNLSTHRCHKVDISLPTERSYKGFDILLEAMQMAQ